ncbi:hypothetical protein PG993_012193 [Apiospora rasikravindrae]|uniref:Helicase-like protein n=1 Tax=Apiospora rasikravindrae TaxID=990691 RepID=A0ABR1S350_9PEZI
MSGGLAERRKMPSFTIFKRGAREFINKPDKREQAPADAGRGPAFDSNANAQGQDQEPDLDEDAKPFGKRQPLKELIRRATVSRRGRPAKLQRRRSAMAATTTHTTSNSSPPVSAAAVRSPRSPIDPNKPLPSPPPPGTIDKADGQRAVPKVLKLKRIMATLSDVEIEKLFSGAPQYFARSQGLGTGAPHPSVAFPWDEELTIRDLSDHTQIEHDAWGNVTAKPRIIQRDPWSCKSPTSKKRPHFNSKCSERPNMLSMQGLEKGSLGYQAALELAVADALQDEQYGFDSLGAKSRIVTDRRQQLVNSKDGLRTLDESDIMELLIGCEQRYQSDRKDKTMRSNELHNELFSKILHPPSRLIDPSDPCSLAGQIYSLVKVLAVANAWIDFSRVEWRIRLGQILWGIPLDDELEDGSSINEGVDDQDRTEERYWLLIQLLLACELLIRLDIITDGDEFGAANLRMAEIHRFEKEANASVRWSLLLARTWLENITVTKTEAPHSGASTPKGWLTSLTNKMSLKHDHIGSHYVGSHYVDASQRHPEYLYAIKGRYTERQVEGLVQFARKLRWPDIETYVTGVSINAPAMARATPINTPATSDTNRSSYFGGERKPGEIQRKPSRRRKVEAALHPAGWLSKSYCSGLILPGEALSHFLMSTLLENDQDAMSKLGPMSNLCGGFIYRGKSFWSTACIVGRVLAAGRGAAECMGWISTDVTPENMSDRWLNIKVEDIPDDVARTGRRARLWGKTIVERESDVLGDADPSNVLPADFIIPLENNYAEPPPSNIRIELRSLNLHTPVDSAHSTPTIERDMTPFSDLSTVSEIHTYPATTSFTMTHDSLEQGQDHDFSLAKDVYFVTAHPCVPSSRVKLLKSPSSPTIQQVDVEGHDWNSKAPSSAYITGHPLHKFYSYTSIHLTELLNKSNATLEDLVGANPIDPSPRRRASSTPRPSRVLVIDCVTGFAPPTSPEMASLSRVSSISADFGLEPLSGSTPSLRLQKPSPWPPLSTTATSASASSSSFGGRRASRIDPPPYSRGGFGSDLEVMVRALCAERGWNAIVSRRRRGCLACAIREAGALGWRVIIRVE